MWREEYRKNNGDVPRIKTTTDADWIAENGTDQVDIASKQFRDLPRSHGCDEDCRASRSCRTRNFLPQGY
jgi:hypothetical protein